jgi:hypothetical protein
MGNAHIYFLDGDSYKYLCFYIFSNKFCKQARVSMVLLNRLTVVAEEGVAVDPVQVAVVRGGSAAHQPTAVGVFVVRVQAEQFVQPRLHGVARRVPGGAGCSVGGCAERNFKKRKTKGHEKKSVLIVCLVTEPESFKLCI